MLDVACASFEKRYAKQDSLMDSTMTTTVSSPTLCSLVAKNADKHVFKWEEEEKKCLLFDNVPGIYSRNCIYLSLDYSRAGEQF